MVKVTLTGFFPEISAVKRQMEKDYVVIKSEMHPEENMICLELELPKVHAIERNENYELEIPAEIKEGFLEELNREEIQFQIEEDDRRLRLSFYLLDKKRVEALYKAFCLRCGMDHDVLQKCRIFVDGHMMKAFEKALCEKGIDHVFTPKGTGYMLELAKMNIPIFERLRSEIGSKILLKPPERPRGRDMSSHRQRGSRSR